MSSMSLGDLAQTFVLQRRGAALKAEMTRLNEELATGQVSDVKSVLAGNVSYLADIESDLNTLSAFQIATSEAAQFTGSVQAALEHIDTGAGTLGTALITAASSAVGGVLDQMSTDAEAEMANIVSALNTSTGGRSIFAGTASDRPALANADVILAGARAAAAGATSPSDLQAALNQWFNDPAGFRSTAYLGSDTDIAPFRLNEQDEVKVQLTADDKVFRDILKNVTMAAIASDTSFSFTPEQQRSVLTEAGGALLESQGALTATRANVGAAEARIDTFETRNSTRKTALEFAKGALLQADPYETATELEAVQFQLESLYTITARMSGLSLVNFVR